MIDFRYHLVSIVAVFLALAIGIVLGATALQGGTIDGLKALNDSLHSQLNGAVAQRNSYAQSANADGSFLQIAEPKLLSGMLAKAKMVLVTEPGSQSTVISGIQKAAGEAGATLTGTIALQPKFNDLSGAATSELSGINSQLAATNGIVLASANTPTVFQQDAAQLIAGAVLEKTGGVPVLASAAAQTVLKSYAQGGFLTYTGSPAGGATLAVIVTPQATASDGPGNWADMVLVALAGQFANESAATLVAGPVTDPSPAWSPVTVLRNSSVSSQVSSVDNASTRLGQISAIWALADQLQGGKPNSYGVSSGASAVSPVPSPVPSVTPTATVTPTSKATGKGKVKRP